MTSHTKRAALSSHQAASSKNLPSSAIFQLPPQHVSKYLSVACLQCNWKYSFSPSIACIGLWSGWEKSDCFLPTSSHISQYLPILGSKGKHTNREMFYWIYYSGFTTTTEASKCIATNKCMKLHSQYNLFSSSSLLLVICISQIVNNPTTTNISCHSYHHFRRPKCQMCNCVIKDQTKFI